MSRLICSPLAVSGSLYRDVLAAASKRGIGRVKAETPDEFASRLAGAVGDGAERADVATLTDAYDTARYGEHEPERAESRHTARRFAAPYTQDRRALTRLDPRRLTAADVFLHPFGHIARHALHRRDLFHRGAGDRACGAEMA